MPFQNRVDPSGRILAIAARGTMMGNRGRLHGLDRALARRRWTTRAWTCCRLSFNGRRRRVMSPGRYTELFFLDEATALAAGHRPCHECRRADYRAFMAAWAQGNGIVREPLRVAEVDRRLHAERLHADGSKRTYHAPLDELPDGAMAILPNEGATPWLIWRGGIHQWTPDGYRPGRIYRGDEETRVLTPRSTVAALRAGYVPALHPSAAGG